jgi:hypothetical protein
MKKYKRKTPDEILASFSKKLKPIKLTKRDKAFFEKLDRNWKKYCEDHPELFKTPGVRVAPCHCPHCPHNRRVGKKNS